jgi:diguanylate cyclase (GGDEF)-like protein
MSKFAAVQQAVLRLVLRLLLALPLHAAATADGVIVDGRGSVPLWPAVTLLVDATHQLQIADVLGTRAAEFAVPDGTPGNLGRSNEAVWLRMALDVHGVVALQRVLEIDYPTLNRVDLYLVRDGQVVRHEVMGNHLRFAERSMPSRAIAAALTLEPGRSELLLRVTSQSSLVLPMTLRTPASFAAQESQSNLLQGIILGLGLCMLLYSLMHYANLRDPLFLQYAVMLVGNLLFMLSYFGVGQRYLWPDWPPLSQHAAPLGILLAVAAGGAFITAALQLWQTHPRVAWVLRAFRIVALGAIALTIGGLLEYRHAQTAATVLGVGMLALVVPVALMKLLRGREPMAACLLLGWSFYLFGAAVISMLLRGFIEPSVLAQYAFPVGTMVEMAAWMGVLGLRVQDIHRHADRVRLESEALRRLAHTDALTGLPNRRGLQDRLAAALPLAGSQQLVAVYLLDLDGFKPVNDRHGHDVGDALLVAVGERLQQQLRTSDVVARLGGDEFVVLAAGLPDEAAARQLGQKMLAAFDEPFLALGQRCDVGLTIGYALAPLDGTTADDLIKRADAAMYAGKQAGRRCMQRGGRSAVTTAAA